MGFRRVLGVLTSVFNSVLPSLSLDGRGEIRTPGLLRVEQLLYS